MYARSDRAGGGGKTVGVIVKRAKFAMRVIVLFHGIHFC